MAERVPVLGQQRLGLGGAQAGLEGRRAGDLVEVEQAVHAAQVEGDERALAAGGEAADDGGAAAEGDEGQAVFRAGGQHGEHLVVAVREDDGGRGVGDVAGAHPQQVGGGLAAGVPDAALRVRAHVPRALSDGGLQRAAGVRVQRRGGYPDLLQREGGGAGVTPSSSRSSPVTVSGSGVARAGSPQPFHSMSIACRPHGRFEGCRPHRPAGRYTVTHDAQPSQPSDQADPSDSDTVLDAVRDCVLAVGVRRTTMTDVARRAGVSRMTLYRRWPDVRSLVGDLMTREWIAVATGAVTEPGQDTDARSRMVEGLVAGVAAFRAHPLFRKIVDVDPELLLPYVLDRRGASQEALLELLADSLEEGHADGSVRRTHTGRQARSVLLVVQSFALSLRTMADEDDAELTPAALLAELRTILERTLAP